MKEEKILVESEKQISTSDGGGAMYQTAEKIMTKQNQRIGENWEETCSGFW